jgi:hypothetical protein
VLRVPLVHGRAFSRDDRAATTPVAILSLAAARLYWGRAEAVGEEVVIEGEQVSRTIVYLPYAQFHRSWLGLIVRATSPPESLAPGIRRALEAARFRPLETVSLDNLFERTVAKPRLVSWTVTACAAIALVVGTSGIFAVLAFSVRQRRREIAVRLAIGASPGRIVGRMIRESVIWILAGLGVGLPVAVALTMELPKQLLDGEAPSLPETPSASKELLMACDQRRQQAAPGTPNMRFWPSLGTTAVRCGYITGDDDADPTGLVHRLVPIIGRWDIGSPPSILSSRPIRSRWRSSTARPEPCRYTTQGDPAGLRAPSRPRALPA